MTKQLLEVTDLRTYFFTEAGVVKAVDGISVSVEEGKTIGLVGESGSGKSVTAQSVLRIIPRPGRIVGGTIKFDGEDLLTKSESEMRKMRRQNGSSLPGPYNFTKPYLHCEEAARTFYSSIKICQRTRQTRQR